MQEFVYHAYYNHVGPSVPTDGLLFLEYRYAAEVDVGPIRALILQAGYLSPHDGSTLQQQNIIVVPIVGAILIEVELQKPTHKRNFDNTYILNEDRRALIGVFNPEMLVVLS